MVGWFRGLKGHELAKSALWPYVLKCKFRCYVTQVGFVTWSRWNIQILTKILLFLREKGMQNNYVYAHHQQPRPVE